MERAYCFILLILSCLNYTYGQNVKSRTFLQGAYQGSSMMSTKINPVIPLNQPYNENPWNYAGNENLNSIPSDMVDWILVELRNSLFPEIIVARKAALLLTNGSLVDVDLSVGVNFPSTPSGEYYLCLYHRNHLPVMSANPITIPNVVPYDFSDTINFPPFGGGSKALIELEPGIFGMIAGDANRDGTIKYSGPGNDRGVILQYILNTTGSTNITTTVNGYRDEDVIMDSIVRYSGPHNDPSVIIQNLVGLTGSTSITSTYNTTVPSIAEPFQCGDSLLDMRDGNKYATTIIGSQCWMAENLAYLPLVRPSNQGSNVLPYYYVYSYEGTNVDTAKTTVNYQTYGVLYNWSAAMNLGASSNNVPSGVQGVCPAGWHLPGDEEWKILEGEVDSQYSYPDPEWDATGWRGTDAGGNLREAGTVHWSSPNTGATNSSGYKALPGGLRGNSGSFFDLGETVIFWSSVEDNSYLAWGHGLYYTNTTVRRYNYYKEYGVSVRCVWDSLPCTLLPTQSDAGPDTTGIMADSIILQGNLPVNGNGVWRIISGIGGVLSDSTSNNSVFYGHQCNVYLLTWTISTACGSSTDTVMIRFGDIPFNCGDTLIDNRDGRFYKTVMIGDHCWMAENLNYGIRIDASQQQTDNGIAEKHCYNDDGLYCDTLGALYQWDELMQYSSEAGVRGLCPAGWHIPTDDEWKNLEGNVDSQYGVGDTIWDITSWRGYDVGKNIKSLSRWVAGGNGDDLYGFTVLPAGRSSNSAFDFFGQKALFWTSNEVSSSSVRHRILSYEKDDIQRASFYKTDGRSVRCLLNPSPCNNLDLSINNGENDTICPGDTSYLNVYVSGGMPPYNYAWSNGNTESSQKVTPSTTSAYTVTVTDALNNSDSDTIMVVVNPTPVADAGVDTTICLGKKAIIGGTTTGGTPPYYFSWNNGHISSLSQTVYPSTTTTYTVTATDSNGCTDINDVTVTVLPSPTVYAGVDDTICDLMKTQIGDSVVGGVPPYTYEWSNDSITLKQIVSPDWTTSYTITVSDANHCKDIDTVKIMVTPTPVLKLGPDDTICKGDTIIIGAEAESGYPPYEYMWYDFYPYQSPYYYREVTPQVSTTYILFVEDAVGCITSDTITIWVNPAPKAHAGSDTSFCGPQTNVLTGSVATEGTPPYEYLWSTDATTHFINVDVSTTTSYTVTVTDSNGCKDEDTVTIVIHPIPHADAGDDRTICKGYTTIIGDTASGGTSPYFYLWNDLTTTFSDTVTPLITSIYTVTVTDANQCTDSDEVAVTIIDVFVDAGPDQYDLCDTAWLMANDPDPYNGYWQIVEGDTNAVFSDTTDPNAYFIGSLDSSYLLSWTIFDTVCNNYYSDSVWIHYAPRATIADAGPDQLVNGTSTNLDGNEAIVGIGKWTIVEGTNGDVVNPKNEKSVFRGMVDSTYKLEWQIAGICDTTRDTVMIIFNDPCLGNTTVTDLYGNAYNIVAIGNQCWMAENLNVGRMLNTPYVMSDNDTTEKYCYDNIAINCDAYGGLYRWDELMNYDTTRGGRGICPCGWHVPTDLEWQILEGFSDSIYGIGDPVWNNNGIRGSDVAFNLKETDTIHWLPPNDSATNSTGYTALPGGAVQPASGFWGYGELAVFWTSSKPTILTNALTRKIRKRDFSYVYGGRIERLSPPYSDYCFSVRCIKDSDSQPFYADAGPDQYDLCDTAWLSANDPGPYLGYWKIIIGDTSAVFSDTTDPKAFFIGSRDSSYLLSWTIIDTVCNIYDSDSVWVHFAPNVTIAYAGPDQTVIGASTNLDGNETLVGDGEWFIVKGTNGVVQDSAYEKSMFDGMIDSTYKLVWQISGVCDTTRDTVMIVFVDPCQGDTSATDPDGNIYKIVAIGSQCWMAENLNVGRMINTQYDMSDNDTTEKYCYDDIATNCDIYGGLYQWDELMNYDTARAGMGICPFGWHVPSDEEWKILEGSVDNTYGVGDPEWDKIYYRGDDAGDNLKAVDSVLWNPPNSNTDASGFKALPGGRVGNYHYSMGIGDFTYLWSSTKYFTAPSSLYRCFFHSVPGVDRHYFSNDYGLSVRCIRDTCQPMPSIADAGPDQDDICDTAWLAANDPSPYIGYWEIIIGDTSAVFSDTTDHNTFFVGSLDSSYLLTWTLVDTICLYQQSDSVWIRYAPSVTIADAGPDQTNVSGTSTNLDGNQALKGAGTWIIAEGTNGNVVNPVYEKSIFNGMADSTYRLVWQISNFCDTTRDTVIIVLGHDTIPPCPGVGTVTDQDGNVYNTVQIGDQCWMRENLKVGKMIQGTYVNGPPKVPQINNDTIEKYCYYNSPDSCEIYGALYTWWEAMDYDTSSKRGICPYGWHIPTDDEWKILEGTVDSLYGVGDPEWDKSGGRGYDAGYALKEAGTKHWYNSLGNDGTNSSGFTALPAAYHHGGAGFQGIGRETEFWTSTYVDLDVVTDVYARSISFNYPTISRFIPFWSFAYSVRCIKTCEPQPSSPDAGPDSLNIITDSIVLMGNTPQTGTGHWDVISGIGGSLSDPADPTSTFFGQRGETYLLRWTISTICYDSIDEVILKFINPPCPEEPLINFMGQTYKTVLIGDQCWMAENLNVGQMINSDYDMSDNDTIEKYCYDDIEANCNIYGGLYNWDELMQYTQTEGSHGICPPHWYIPSDEEWKILEGTVDHTYGVGDPEWDDDYWRGDDGGDNLKAVDNVLWDQPNSNTNKSGFNALPGGRMSSYGSFSYDGDDAYFWTSTEYSSYGSWYRNLDHSKSGIYRNDLSKSYSISVRCIRDTCLPYPIQADAGKDSLDIQADSIILYANVPVNGTGTWSIISGTGGSFNDSTSPDAVFYGISNLSYVLRWTISTVCGSTYDEVIISFAQKPITPCPGIPTVSYSGQVYNTVLIGTQCWMRENLNVGAMINIGTAQLDNQIIEKYCYDDDSSNCDIYGGLYRWKEMMDYETNLGARGICPAGWHIPTPDEFDELVNYLGGSTIAGGKMKEFGFDHWNSPNNGASNDCGFTALGAGYAGFYSASYLKEKTYFWTSLSVSFGYNGRAFYLKYDDFNIINSTSSINNGYSVRCLKDD